MESRLTNATVENSDRDYMLGISIQVHDSPRRQHDVSRISYAWQYINGPPQRQRYELTFHDSREQLAGWLFAYRICLIKYV